MKVYNCKRCGKTYLRYPDGQDPKVEVVTETICPECFVEGAQNW